MKTLLWCDRGFMTKFTEHLCLEKEDPRGLSVSFLGLYICIQIDSIKSVNIVSYERDVLVKDVAVSVDALDHIWKR